MKTQSLIFSFFFLFSLICFGQNGQKNDVLKIGDKLPDIKLTSMLNYKSKTAHFSDFKGKLLILDFWNTGCKACIESWPKLLELQKQYADKIQIMLVNPWEDEAAVKKVFDRRKKLAGVNVTLPAACRDTALFKYFNIDGLPELYWINESGVLANKTTAATVNSKNIRAVLDNPQRHLRQKVGNDEFTRPDFKQPLFVNGNGGKVKEVLWNSILAKYPDSLWLTANIVAMEKYGYRAVCSGCDVLNLYGLAYSNRFVRNFPGWIDILPMNRVKLLTKDSSKYFFRYHGEENWDNMYVYNLSGPETTLDKLQQKMQADLKWAFNLNVQWTKKKEKCYVLSISDPSLLKKDTLGGKRRLIMSNEKIDINNITVAYFIECLTAYTAYTSDFGHPPIVDETNFKGMLNGISFETNVPDHISFDKALQPYGLRFTIEEREIDVLEISEPPGYRFPFGKENKTATEKEIKKEN